MPDIRSPRIKELLSPKQLPASHVKQAVEREWPPLWNEGLWCRHWSPCGQRPRHQNQRTKKRPFGMPKRFFQFQPLHVAQYCSDRGEGYQIIEKPKMQRSQRPPFLGSRTVPDCRRDESHQALRLNEIRQSENDDNRHGCEEKGIEQDKGDHNAQAPIRACRAACRRKSIRYPVSRQHR